MESISLRQTNHFVLRKHHLTDDTKNGKIIQIVKDIGGLHSTHPFTPYLSLFAREKRFKKEDFQKIFTQKRELGKIRFVRKTVYILPKDWLSLAFAATKTMAETSSTKYASNLGVSQSEYIQVSQDIKALLRGCGLNTKEIRQKLGLRTNVSAIVNLMCDQGILIRGESRYGWKSNLHTYYLFHEYFPDIDLKEFKQASARESVVRYYLASFGPVSIKDIVWWTGFSMVEIKKILANLQDEIEIVEISGLDGQYLILLPDKIALESTVDPKKQVINFLPLLDPYLMGYKERLRYLHLEYYDYVFDRSGNSTYCILLDGKVVGVWDLARNHEPEVKIFLFRDVDHNVESEIFASGKSIGRFLAGVEVRIRRYGFMLPLPQRTAGGFMSPLRDSV